MESRAMGMQDYFNIYERKRRYLWPRIWIGLEGVTREWLVCPHKTVSRTDTCWTAPPASQTFETAKVTGAALAILLMYNPEPRQGKRKSGASPERRELAGCSAGWSHDSASVEEVDLCHCSALGVCAHHYVLRMFKAILGSKSICSKFHMW